MVNQHNVRALSVAILVAWSQLDSANAQPPNEADAAVSVPCVLLKNDNVLFGQAHQAGEYVVVKESANT